jgi:hypothetical protein
MCNGQDLLQPPLTYLQGSSHMLVMLRMSPLLLLPAQTLGAIIAAAAW